MRAMVRRTTASCRRLARKPERHDDSTEYTHWLRIRARDRFITAANLLRSRVSARHAANATREAKVVDDLRIEV